MEGRGVIGDRTGGRDDALLFNFPVIDGDGEALHEGHIDDNAAGFAGGSLGLESAITGGDAAAIRGAVGGQTCDRAAVRIGAAGDSADERTSEELGKVRRAETLVIGGTSHDPRVGAPVDAILRFGGIAEIGVALITRRGAELERTHEGEREFVADERNHRFEVGGGDVAVTVSVGIGREAEEVVALGIEAGAGRIQAGVGRTIIIVSLIAELAADGAADGVAAPEREHITRGANIAATEFRDAVADEFRAERRGDAVGIFIVTGGDERAVLHGKGAGERIKRFGRIGLVDGGD